MPDLEHSLPANDLSFLRIVAKLWGVELESNDPVSARTELAGTLCDAELLEEVITTLADDAQDALGSLMDANGRIAWTNFSRRFGDIREMGPGKRDREEPYLNPSSVSETLFYRALMARSFFETLAGVQEFAYIPDDLREALEMIGFKVNQNINSEAHEEREERAEIKKENVASLAVNNNNVLGRAATPLEKANPQLANDRLLDDATTLLAAIRTGVDFPETKIPQKIVLEFLKTTGILESKSETKWELKTEELKLFLECTRTDALKMIYDAWIKSETFNELRLMPTLICEIGWENDPLATRKFLFSVLEDIPRGQWWSMVAFLRDLKTQNADFQRPAGDYDSWFIKRAADDTYLRGFSSWDEVDGALVRFFITQILFWLGQVEIASVEKNGASSSFRLSSFDEKKNEDGKIFISSKGSITVEHLAPRAARYQVTRFCDWVEEKGDGYHYHVTTQSLERAKAQGLKVDHLFGVLRKYSSEPIPPPFVKALQRWETNGTEARLDQVTVLKVTKPQVLDELRKSNASRFLGELLGPTSIIIKDGAEAKVLSALAEMGLLAEVVSE